MKILEYDPIFTDLMLAAQPGEERQAGDEIIPGEEPDYKLIIEKATDVLGRSHDLRAAVLLGLAGLKTGGLPAFADATRFIRGCLEEFWDTCHPQLDAEDDDDPTMRVNAIRGLADTGTVVRALRTAHLTNSRQIGRFSYRDIEIAEGEIAVPDGLENVPNTAAISAAFRDTDTADLDAALDAARTIHDDLKAIDAIFDERTPGRGPDLSAILRVAKRIHDRLSVETGAGDGDAAETGDAPAGAESAAAPAARGPISSPADVVRSLDQIIEYYGKHEPSSPLPLLLNRARRLVGADFMAIVRDLAPSGSDEVKAVGGITEATEE